MRIPSLRSPRAARSLVRGVAVAVCAVVALTGGVAAAASASPATASASTVGAVTAGPVVAPAPTTGVGRIDVLKEVLLQVQASPDSGGRRPGKTVKIDSGSDGRIKIELDQYCLDTWAEDGFKAWRTLAYPDDCKYEPSQDFYLVPASKTPTAVANADHAAAADGQWFSIVSMTGKQCLASPEGGLFPHRPDLSPLGFYDYAKQAPCDSSDPKQHFRIVNEVWEGDVALKWQAILDLAVTWATRQCGTDTSIEAAPCQIKFANDPTGEWLIPGFGRSLTFGTLTPLVLGCGTSKDKVEPKRTNLSGRDETLTVASTVSSQHSVEWGIGLSLTLSAEMKVGKADIASVTKGASFTINGNRVETSTEAVSREFTVSQTVSDGMTLMNTWSAQGLVLDGTWKVGLDIPAVSKGDMAWTFTAVSTLPVDNGEFTNSVIATHSNKSCTASPASVNTVRPSIVTSTESCDTAKSPDVATPGIVNSTLKVCPGTWSNTGTDTSRVYSYQWYTVLAGTTNRVPIPDETGPTLRVLPSFYSPTQTLYIGAYVIDEGPSSRFASARVVADHEAQVAAATVPTPAHFDTNFAGWLPDAHTETAYSQQVVTMPGTAMSLTTDQGALKGLRLSADGILSGTPRETGEITFTVTDTPTDGGAVTTRDFTLRVFAKDPPQLSDSPALAGTVGEAFSQTLIAPDAGDTPVLAGSIPPGLAFDASTGTLSGTPTQDGTSGFVLSTSDYSQAYTVTTADVPMVLSDAALPVGTVGAAYSAQTVVSLGSDAQVGRLAVTQPGENALVLDPDPAAPEGQRRMPALLGLTLDARTGQLSGTPTSAGTVVIAVANLADPSTPAQVKTLTVLAADGASAGSSDPAGSGRLAATGFAPGLAIPGSLAVLLLGALVLLLARRLRRG
ncbi:putative Ig domain-containing protein [Herbiconiux sp.]|uniref:putative Ig domain-containing protein n=1 Tax=Herbiconiux sp. TaxID=1871186 RepID=UPI0025BD42EA|nr:putative Ig domain-containing protein [Herbiconiux sp.]